MNFSRTVLEAGLLLCFCATIVTCLDPGRLRNSLAYMRNLEITTEQFAYAIKLTKAECDTLDNNVMTNVLLQDPVEDMRDAVAEGYVYEGHRIAFAKAFYSKPDWIHAEYRLLVPDEYGTSPVQRLLQTEPNSCVLFHSLISPCLDYCLTPQGPFTFVQDLKVFDNIDNNYKAFSYTHVFTKDKCRPTRDQVWDAWKQIRDRMPFFRCGNQPQCIECFAKGQESKDQCLAGFSQA
ncbi:uncharacterized protein LOC144827473 [Lissotriton helveticus]